MGLKRKYVRSKRARGYGRLSRAMIVDYATLTQCPPLGYASETRMKKGVRTYNPARQTVGFPAAGGRTRRCAHLSSDIESPAHLPPRSQLQSCAISIHVLARKATQAYPSQAVCGRLSRGIHSQTKVADIPKQISACTAPIPCTARCPRRRATRGSWSDRRTS